MRFPAPTGHTELAALPHYAEVTPARVLPYQANYQGNHLVVKGVGRERDHAEGRSRTGRRVSRCQRNSVAGVTRNAAQRSRLRSRASVASKARSAGEYRGRATWRLRTANRWRSTAISMSFSSGVGPSRSRSSSRRTSSKVIWQAIPTILAGARHPCSDARS